MKRHLMIFVTILTVFTFSVSFAQQAEGEGAQDGAYAYHFNGGPKPEWEPVFGEWTMLNGKYTLKDIQDDKFYAAVLNKPLWPDLMLSVDVTPGQNGGHISEAIIFPRMSGPDNGVCFWLEAKYGAFQKAGWKVYRDGMWGQPNEVIKVRTGTGKTVQVRIDVKDNIYTAYVDGSKISQIYDDTFKSSSFAALGQWYEHRYVEDPVISFDNFLVGPWGGTMISRIRGLREKEAEKEKPGAVEDAGKERAGHISQ
ncbi:MAG: hypothetical protein ABII06_19030, partial [Pseudomonadota bacterium]